MLGKRVVRQLFRVADLLFALGLAALPTYFDSALDGSYKTRFALTREKY